MIAQRITDGIFSLRSIDWDRKLFDELVPLPEGTTYNSYLVKGTEKTALIDTVYPPKAEELIAALAAAGVETLDYIVAIRFPSTAMPSSRCVTATASISAARL